MRTLTVLTALLVASAAAGQPASEPAKVEGADAAGARPPAEQAAPAPATLQIHAPAGLALSIDGVDHGSAREVVLSPGRHTVVVGGATVLSQEIEVPAAPSTLQIERRDEGYRKVGLAGAIVGGSLMAIGAAATLWYVFGYPDSDPCKNDHGYCYNSSWWLAGIVFEVAAVNLILQGLIVGGTMGVRGLNRAGVDRITLVPGRLAEQQTPRLRLVGLGAALAPGGAVAGATFVF